MTGASRSLARRAAAALPSAAPLLALSGFAWGQPVLSVLGGNPELVAFRGAGRLDLWLVGLAVVAVVPAVLWGVELLAAVLVPSARPAIHLLLVGLLGAGLGAQVAARLLGLDGIGVALVAAAGGAAVAAVEGRRLVRMWLSFAAWAPLAFVVLFAALSPAAAAVGDAGGGGAGGVAVADPARVVVLVLDELPLATLLDAEGTVDGELFPGFAELAGASHWFREASAVSNATVQAVPSLLTGRFPDGDALPVVADHPDNLFTLLGGSYRMEVAESITRLCPAALCGDDAALRAGTVRTLVGDGARLWQEQIGLRAGSDPLAAFREPAGDAVGAGWDDVGLQQPERFTSLLRSFDGAPARTLHYAHLLLPHTPSRYLPSGRTYGQPVAELGPFWEEPGRFFDLWIDDPGPVAVGRQRAVLQTQYVDRLLSKMIDELRRLGEWDRSLVVVTSDHGRSFQAGRSARALTPGPGLEPVLPEVVGVPLFVKVPGQGAGEVHDGNVQLVDVVPTIADVLGVRLPWEVDGRSAFAGGARPATKTVHQQVLDADLRERPGEVFDVPAAGFFPRVADHGVHRLVPPGGELRAYRVGEGADLVGQPVPDEAVGSAGGVQARVHGLGAFERVERSSGALPAFVVGELSAPHDGPVAVVLNGRVAGVLRPFPWEGRDAVFTVVAAEDLFVEGVNRLEVYLLHAGGDRWEPVELTP